MDEGKQAQDERQGGGTPPQPQQVSGRTGYQDSRGTPIMEGDRLAGYFGAPWDEEVPVRVTFTVIREFGSWFCRGIEDNEFNDYLWNLADHLTVCAR